MGTNPISGDAARGVTALGFARWTTIPHLWQSMSISARTLRESMMATLNVSMPDAMREWVDAQVESGEYANASDYIRDLIRHNQREDESIRLALIEGERSGVSSRSVMEIARRAKRQLKRG